jgi:hypothetical protein
MAYIKAAKSTAFHLEAVPTAAPAADPFLSALKSCPA